MAELIHDITDDLRLLLDKIPKRLEAYLLKRKDTSSLVEIVLDLGAKPEIRFLNSECIRTELDEVTIEEIDRVVRRIGEFNADNRAGIGRTLHRISAIRNRDGKIIGLTCRVGRAVVGTIEIIRDIVESGKNILLLGPPGIGKTTKLREIARVLSTDFKKRVIVVDTSNEVAGDGNIPHPGIGAARRMQVPKPNLQHKVMIEAVENHMPEVIIIDEIGTEQETEAAATIAERGVQLVATAHGHSLENLIKNNTISNLVGSVQSVILGDEEAKMRGTQKTVLERRGPATFDCLIEIRERDLFMIYSNIEDAVDAYCRQEIAAPEIRTRDASGAVVKKIEANNASSSPLSTKTVDTPPSTPTEWCRIFPYGINQERLQSAIHSLNLSVKITNEIHDADLVLTVKSHAGRQSKLSKLVKGRHIPVHLIKQNSVKAISTFFKHYFSLETNESDEMEEILRETKKLCLEVQKKKKPIESSPHDSQLRRYQHELVKQFSLTSISVGEEPNRRVRVCP